ncbi:MAG: hypothetical protein H0V29_08440 [Thermoleophilaceae bacterium]|nr:hypothetical protein [Thermoleophilaceae bacterium]
MPHALLTTFALTFALSAAPALAQAPAPAEPVQPPEPIPLNSGWEFKPDPGDIGQAQAWQRRESTDPASWNQGITLPHAIETRSLSHLFGGSVGWYRLKIDGPTAPGGFAWSVHFGQIRRNGQAWLNGQAIGIAADGYSAQDFIAKGLVPGQANELVVRVDFRRSAKLREGWWNWGGLIRTAELRPLGSAALQDTAILPRLDCAKGSGCKASVVVDTVVENRTSDFISPALIVDLAPPGEGIEPTQVSINVAPLRPRERRPVRFTVPVTGTPKLWAPEHPNLYKGSVSVRVAGRTEAVYDQKVGLRSVQVRRGRLFLNGRGVRLRGASIQEDVKGHGAALTDEDNTRIVTQLKDLGADITRAHYGLSDELLSKFDEAGILVWSQAPIYHRDALMRQEPERARALAQVRRTVIEARRHASVMTHSVANELSPRPDEVPSTKAFMLSAAKDVRALDSSVPVSVDILPYPGFRFQKAHAAFDLLGVNSYFGWYKGKRTHSTASIFDFEPYLRAMRRRYRKQAMVVTEFGAEALHEGSAGKKGTFAFQSRYIRRMLDVVDKTKFVDGAIYWTLGEFAVKPKWDGGLLDPSAATDSIHNKALIDYNGKRKPAWDVAHDRFKRVDLYR